MVTSGNGTLSAVERLPIKGRARELFCDMTVTPRLLTYPLCNAESLSAQFPLYQEDAKRSVPNAALNEREADGLLLSQRS